MPTLRHPLPRVWRTRVGPNRCLSAVPAGRLASGAALVTETLQFFLFDFEPKPSSLGLCPPIFHTYMYAVLRMVRTKFTAVSAFLDFSITDSNCVATYSNGLCSYQKSGGHGSTWSGAKRRVVEFAYLAATERACMYNHPG